MDESQHTAAIILINESIGKLVSKIELKKRELNKLKLEIEGLEDQRDVAEGIIIMLSNDVKKQTQTKV